jgi:hypothetical protein
VTLSNEQIERYSRQIVLPEVGGRGQERLLAARVAILGHSTSAATAATLLGRAGVGVLELHGTIAPLPELSPDCRVYRDAEPPTTPLADVVVSLVDETALDEEPGVSGVLVGGEQARRPFVFGVRSSAHIQVATLVGQPCVGCLGHSWPRMGVAADEPTGAPGTLALGALAASEVLRVLLSPPVRGRITTLALEGCTPEVKELGPTRGCELCGGRA